MPHIVSLIASATEIVCALGYGDQLVGRSHECDYPKEVERLPVCTGPRFDVTGSSREIDELVKATLRESPSVYRVDAELLQALEPDVIVTQAQCEVCAVSEKDVVAALGADQGRTRVVVLSPLALADVWHNIGQVAEALGVPERGQALAAALQQRVASIAAQAQRLAARPTVACLEWLDPLMAAGNWVPELVELAGGVNLFGAAGRHAPALGWDELCRADPDVIVALPCGFDLQRTRRELAAVAARPGWDRLTSVRQGRVYATDGNQFFNRPGPRLVESLEILAEILHPQAFPFGHAGSDWCALRDR
jgi:iron complex transport system substrate-binding protein